MGDIFERENIVSPVSNPEPVYFDCVDLTDDEAVVSSTTPENLSLVSHNTLPSESSTVQNNDSQSADDSLSVIYEHVIPPPEIQIVENCNDILVRFYRKPSIGTQNFSQKVTVGSRTLNVSASITSKAVKKISPSDVQVVNRIYPDKSEESPSCSRNVSQKVTVGSRTLNLSTSITNDAVEKIPQSDVQVVNRINSDKSEESPCCSKKQKTSKLECGICFDGSEEISSSKRTLVATVCGHIFCNECLEKHMKILKKECPKCRKRLTIKQFHPLYI